MHFAFGIDCPDVANKSQGWSAFNLLKLTLTDKFQLIGKFPVDGDARVPSVECSCASIDNQVVFNTNLGDAFGGLQMPPLANVVAFSKIASKSRNFISPMARIPKQD